MSTGRPGVFYKQRDLSQTVVGLDSSILGIAGNAKWGPVDEITLVDNLDKFVQFFGEPVSPSVTPMFYQMLGWFRLGRTAYVVRPQGDSAFGGVEALVGDEVAGIGASLTSLPSEPSGSNVVGIYTKYPGVHPEGDIYVNITNSDNTTGEFIIQAGVVLDSAGTALDTGDAWFEEHAVSVISTAKDGNGRSKYIEDVLERDSQLLAGRAVADAAVTDVPDDSTSLTTLAQATYVAATQSEISLAYDLFKSLDAVTIDLLVPGDFDDTVLNKLVDVAVARGDCFCILTPPVEETWDVDGISGATGWKADISTLNELAAAYAMYYKVKDEYNDRDVFVPAAGFIAGAYAYNDANGDKWTAPAGRNRGIQLNVDLGKNWLPSEQDQLYNNNVNFVKKSPSAGITIEGQKTLLASTSALSRVNVSRLVLKLKRDVLNFLQDYLYEINNDQTRSLISNQIRAYLSNLGSQGAFNTDQGPGFRVICDATNNPPSVVDANELYVDVYIKPARTAEFLYLRTTITASGIDFDSIISIAS